MDNNYDWLELWSKESTDNFKKNHRIKSFKEYLGELKEKPYSLSRNSVQYLLDMLEYFGEDKSYSLGALYKKFKVFSTTFPNSALPKMVGQEEVINEIYSDLKNFVLEGGADRIIHLHGPSCSGKSLIVEYLMQGIEEYSRKKEGTLYSFHWIFPLESGKRMGFGEQNELSTKLDSYAHLSAEQTSFKLPCDVNDSPLLLIPPKRRLSFLEELLKNVSDEEKVKFMNSKYILEADLCERCRQIFDALHDEYQGDVEEILKHIQVRRLYLSRKYQRGAVVISPQETPDATSRIISADTNWDAVPSPLQHLVLEQLTGSIVNANNGIVEFSDFLTRPPELNKYLLSAVDKGGIEIAQNSVSLNLVMFATSNEENLDSFKQSADFPPFKGRMSFIPVPYLLERSKESLIHLENLKRISNYKHISPSLHLSSGLWAVLTRLLKPNAENYPKELRETISSITPYEKAVIYDSFSDFSVEMVHFDKKKLETIFLLSEEYKETQFYEGRFGFSPRDITDLFYDEAYNRENNCIGMNDFLEGISYLTRDHSLYKFLQLKPDAHYHDLAYFFDTARKEYLRFFEEDVLVALNVYPQASPFFLIRGYFSYLLNKQMDDKKFIELEKSIRNGKEDEPYRNALREKMEESLKYSDWGFIPIFCSEVAHLKKDKLSKKKAKVLNILENALLLLIGGEKQIEKGTIKESEGFVNTMIEKFNYCPNCLYENLRSLLKQDEWKKDQK